MDQFEAHRGKLFSIAYHMLGTVSDAEDAVQETYVRYRSAAKDDIRSPDAYLSTILTRLCLNQLQSARARRETYIGPWLPEPLLTEEDQPLAHADAQESISMAFLLLLERLTPAERAVFLLHEVFDYSHAEIAEILGREETACRQIFRRAKQFIAAQRPRFTPSTEQHQQLLRRFLDAVTDGEMEPLVKMLSDDVVLRADGGGKARGAATHPLYGHLAVAKFVIGSVRLLSGEPEIQLTWANGEPAAILRVGGQPVTFIGVTIQDDLITEIRAIGNPDKLGNLDTRHPSARADLRRPSPRDDLLNDG